MFRVGSRTPDGGRPVSCGGGSASAACIIPPDRETTDVFVYCRIITRPVRAHPLAECRPAGSGRAPRPFWIVESPAVFMPGEPHGSLSRPFPCGRHVAENQYFCRVGLAGGRTRCLRVADAMLYRLSHKPMPALTPSKRVGERRTLFDAIRRTVLDYGRPAVPRPVGPAGLEPATSRPPAGRADQLRHNPWMHAPHTPHEGGCGA